MSRSTPLVSLQQLVQDFFETHLPVERNASRNTILAYRDAIELFLQHAASRRRLVVEELDFAAFDVDMIRSFLSWLRSERHCGARTRNQRLAALKSFARYVASVAPEHMARCHRIRELPPPRFERPQVSYLSGDEVHALVLSSNTTQSARDRALLLLLYNTGARAQEIVDLDVDDLRIDPVSVVTLEGKGRKQRSCPLWDRTVSALLLWLEERGPREGPLFLNARGHRLSRWGVAYILRKTSNRAGLSPQHAERVSPHVIRHTTAMHLLQAGVDITTIAAWLGHAQLETTHAYVDIDLRMKQQALAATALPQFTLGRFPKDKLLRWLTALRRPTRYGEWQTPGPAR